MISNATKKETMATDFIKLFYSLKMDNNSQSPYSTLIIIRIQKLLKKLKSTKISFLQNFFSIIPKLQVSQTFTIED